MISSDRLEGGQSEMMFVGKTAPVLHSYKIFVLPFARFEILKILVEMASK